MTIVNNDNITNQNYKTLHRKLMIEQHEPHVKSVLRKGKQILLHYGTRRVTLVTIPLISNE